MNLIISENVNDTLPEYLIRIIRYIWETELAYQEAVFCLEKSGVSQQNITAYVGNTIATASVITLAIPVESKVSFRKFADGFIMALE